jgi:hypothetical protein
MRSNSGSRWRRATRDEERIEKLLSKINQNKNVHSTGCGMHHKEKQMGIYDFGTVKQT